MIKLIKCLLKFFKRLLGKFRNFKSLEPKKGGFFAVEDTATVYPESRLIILWLEVGNRQESPITVIIEASCLGQPLFFSELNIKNKIPITSPGSWPGWTSTLWPNPQNDKVHIRLNSIFTSGNFKYGYLAYEIPKIINIQEMKSLQLKLKAPNFQDEIIEIPLRIKEQ